MNNHTPALTVEQWTRTSIKKRIYRVKDLRKYVNWCEKQNGSDCYQISFAFGQIENIRQSTAPADTEELNKEIAVSLQTAQRITEHGVIRGFTSVRSWFSKVRVGVTLGKVEMPATGEAFAFVVSSDYSSTSECFTLAELFEHEVCDRAVISDHQIDGLLDEALRRFEEWRCEKQALINELGEFYKEVEQIK